MGDGRKRCSRKLPVFETSMAAARLFATARLSPRSLWSRFVFPHVFDLQFCLSASAEFPQCLGSIHGLGRGHDFGISNAESCRSIYTRLPLSAVVPSERFKHGVQQPGSVFQTRGLAAKPKKAKSKVEAFAPSEDIAATAKGNAVRMMETALDVLSREHSKLRTGRASAGMLDHITVEAHGVRTPLSHIAAVTVAGLQTLNVLPYDATMVKEVEKAILNSPMGLNPQVDGATMIVPLPRLTTEHCETMCKLVGKSGEASKLTIRRARKEALDTAKNSGELSKDEMKRFEKEVEETTKKYSRSIDEICKNKEKEIMS